MGFCFQDGKLVCENCGAVGGVRKVPCPAGYCQADALCAPCRKDPEVKAKLRVAHGGCAEAHARFRAEQEAVAAVQATGAYTFCASLYADSTRETVRCWFRNAAGDTKEMVVSNEERDKLTRTSTYDEAFFASHFKVVHVRVS